MKVELTITNAPKTSFKIECENILLHELQKLLQEKGHPCQCLFLDSEDEPIHEYYRLLNTVQSVLSKTQQYRIAVSPIYLGYELGLIYNSETIFLKAKCDLLLKDVFTPTIPKEDWWKIRYVSLPDSSQYKKYGDKDLTHNECYNINKTTVADFVQLANKMDHLPVLIPRLKLIWQNFVISVPLMTTGIQLLNLIKLHEMEFDCNQCCSGYEDEGSDSDGDYNCTCETNLKLPFKIKTPAGKSIEINQENSKIPLVDRGVVHHSVVYDTHQPSRTPRREWSTTWAYERHPLPYKHYAIFVVKQTTALKEHQFLPLVLQRGQNVIDQPSAQEINELPFSAVAGDLNKMKIETSNEGLCNKISIGEFEFYFHKRKFTKLIVGVNMKKRKFSNEETITPSPLPLNEFNKFNKNN